MSVRRALLCLLVGLLVVPATAASQVQLLPTKPGNPICLKQTDQPEVYGPTDVGATLANEHLSVAVNPEGTLSVFRWPSRSYYEQVRYNTVSRSLPDWGLDPSEGAFSGLSLTLRDGSHELRWLRDLKVRQRYASVDSDSVTTRFRDRSLGLVLEIADVVPAGADVLIRRHVLRLGKRSPVRRASLVAYANFNPTAAKLPLLPVEDWCLEVNGTDVARYDADADAVTFSVSETDTSILAQRSIAVAMGMSRRSRGHHVGADTYTEHVSTLGGPESAYDDAADGLLSGNAELGPAEADAALMAPLGRRPVNVVFSVAGSETDALARLERYRRVDARRKARRKRADMLRWLARAPLPRGAPRSHVELAKRSLIALRQAVDLNAGSDGEQVAIVASLSTQSPYYVDWIRDGAFFNEALDVAGHPGLVRRHNAFYADVQHKLEEGAPPATSLTTCAGPTPSGAWFMTNYADGGNAGTFPFEIDEAGLGVWALYRHYEIELERGRTDAAQRYLEGIYPAIARGGDLLVAFRDPLTGLTPGLACEDDNIPDGSGPTMHASGPALIGIRSAEAAARALGRADDEARYAARSAELEAAIDARHVTETGAWTPDFGDGGWALWPIVVKPYDHERMRAQAERVWAAVKPAFLAPDGPRKRGQYEAKALLGLAHYYGATDPRKMRRVKRGLRWIADTLARVNPTGVIGESWRVDDGKLISFVSQPHVWEHALYYLAVIEAYGRSRYRPGAPDRLLRPR